MNSDITKKVDEFFAQHRLRKYAKGQVLILNDEKPEHIYYLVSGTVKKYDVTYRGDEIILNIFKPPAFFPMSPAMNDTPNPYIYEADTDIEVRLAPNAEVLKFIQDNPDVLYDLLSRVYRGMDGMLGRMSYLMAASAKSRLIYELVIDARRFGVKAEDGSCELSVSEKDLGARAGLSRETVSREMTKLKNDHLVELHHKGIRIHNLAVLEKKLGQHV